MKSNIHVIQEHCGRAGWKEVINEDDPDSGGFPDYESAMEYIRHEHWFHDSDSVYRIINNGELIHQIEPPDMEEEHEMRREVEAIWKEGLVDKRYF